MTTRSNPSFAFLPTALTILTGTALLASASAQHLIREFHGIQDEGRSGQAIASAGDVDGDGTDDLIVGQPLTDYAGAVIDRGSVIVYSGANGSWLASSVGSRSGMQLGTSVCRLGDVDGDGVTDFAAGAPFDDAAGNDAGYVRVFSGSTGATLWDLTGEPSSRFGFSLCAIGDLDHDGAPDLAIGAPKNSNVRAYGAVYFHSGRTGARLAMAGGGNLHDFGHAIACPGDLDGDGRPDLVVGSPSFDFLSANSGNVRAFGMRGTSTPHQLWIRHDTFINGEKGGTAVAGLGDLDGDGKPDVLVSGVRGRVFALSGATGAVLRTHHGLDTAGFGAALTGLDDVDGDGVKDYAIGSPLGGAGGEVELLSGRTGAVITTLSGTSSSGFGASLAGLRDFDGDGLGEVAVGSPLWRRSDGRRAGRATVHGVDLTGAVTPFGNGCSGSQPFGLTATGSARPGRTLTLTATNTRIAHFVVTFLGVSHTDWNGTPLPFTLSAIGEPGCKLHVSIDVILSTRVVAPIGVTQTVLQIPNVPALIGDTTYAQAIEFLPGRPLRSSNGLSIYVGNR